MNLKAGNSAKNMNPIICADFPEPDVIRVGDTYYMICATMHFFPGGTLLKSYDLVHWEIAAHVFERLDDTPAEQLEGEQSIYGKGMWAASLRYHKDTLIANYSIYNTLVVSAPEIRGLWDFTLIPATEVTDETGAVTKNRSVYSTGTCSMMIKTEDETVRQNAWTFMKWWAQTDTQVRFGRELEALLGSSARYATANREAFDQLAWSADDVEVLEEQWKSAVGFREVAGGYYTGRHIVNAVRKVINEKEDPRETILDYAITINDELIKKRTEFGLPTD